MEIKRLCFAAFAAFGMGFAAFAGEWDGVLLQGRTLEDKAFYAPGEKMTFELRLTGAEQATNRACFIKWVRTGDDGKREEGKVPASADEPLVLETSLDKPGFVRIFAELVDKDGKPCRKDAEKYKGEHNKIFFDGGAGVEPEKLQSVPEPADFDAFWTKQKARLVAMPMTVRRKELPSQQGRVYAVEISCPSVRPVTGYLQVPADASPTNRYPCRLDLHGYGYYPNPKAPTGAWHKDALVLSINAHGLRLPEFGADAAYYKALEWEIKSNGHTYGFDPKQNADPETAYFNGMALRVMRALQYLKSLPEWNGKDLIAAGGSQGGLQTIWAAALDPDVTRAESTITWCCDMGGTELGRNRGGWYVRWVPALGYYDPVNMARRIPKTCLTVIPRAGLGDYTCPPSGLAVLYNNIPGPKKIVWMQGSTHGYIPPQKDNQIFTWTANGAE
mgnify:FL=1